MSAEIKSGASPDLLVVDPVSKAARVTLYNQDGSLVERMNDGKYVARVEVVPTTLTAGTIDHDRRSFRAVFPRDGCRHAAILSRCNEHNVRGKRRRAIYIDAGRGYMHSRRIGHRCRCSIGRLDSLARIYTGVA